MRRAFILFLFIFSSTLMALAEPPTALELRILEAQKTCPQLNCPQSSVHVINMTQSEQRDLGRENRARMKELAVELARNLWPDTVLEGPYENANRFRMDTIQKLVVDGVLVGYRVTYSDKAWDLDTCNYDPADPKTIQDCETGRIFESAFVNLELTSAFRDNQALADYKGTTLLFGMRRDFDAGVVVKP